MTRVLLLLVAIAAFAATPADAKSGRRVALVVGNAAYEEASHLINPVNDAVDISAKLRALGFEVIEGNDLGKRALERKIGEFADALEGAEAGLFFYAGHGIQVDGRNYVLPTDARIDVPVKLKLESVPMDEILDIMETQVSISLVFLDACRNDPFANRSGKDRSAKAIPGLAQFDSSRNSFIAFSTRPGSVAMDGSGRNSPFAKAMLSHMGEPGRSISDMMESVTKDVLAATRDQQRPFVQASLTERFEFSADGSAAPVAAAEPSPATETEVASLDRSVADPASVESFVTGRYLAPDADSIRETVRRTYADNATVYGVPYGFDALVKVKSDWFAQFSKWELALVPGSLVVVPRGTDRADAAFAMSYDYQPKDPAWPRQTGRAQVQLGLVLVDGEWRVESESSQAAQ